MKGLAIYAALNVVVVGLVAVLLTLGFDGPGEAAAIRLSAIVVVVVQLVTFGVVKLMGPAPTRVFIGWGLGALVRVLTLVIYAVLTVKVLALPAAAALLSMAAFFFLTTLIEPLLLKV